MTDALPEPKLTQAMLARSHDLANYMRLHGQTCAVGSEVGPNGTRVTVILAIDDAADIAKQVGAELVRRVGENSVRVRRDAQQN